jgi:hypothetical protein
MDDDGVITLTPSPDGQIRVNFTASGIEVLTDRQQELLKGQHGYTGPIGNDIGRDNSRGSGRRAVPNRRKDKSSTSDPKSGKPTASSSSYGQGSVSDSVSQAQTIADAQLGLTADEIQILRQYQQLALQGNRSNGKARRSARSSAISSTASSAASSQARLLLDPRRLQQLGYYFDQLMRTIQQRLDAVGLLS